jgi:predicted lysophospholipase L1 biosynthesis ABC-type transport system permease subunit
VSLIAGRDFHDNETAPGVAVVTETFAKQYFDGKNPVGKSFQRRPGEPPYQIVGLAGDVRYRRMREPMLPIAFVPFLSIDAHGAPRAIVGATFIVRTSSPNPLALASVLRAEVTRARPEFRVSNIRTQAAIKEAQTVRERLLATLALFFSGVALALAAIGIYGVLDYSVLQRRREIGIRMALGARVSDVAQRVTSEVFSVVLVGGVAGVGLGVVSMRFLAALFFDVKATDLSILAMPLLMMFGVTLLAALPPAIRAARINPVRVLRAD